MTQVIVLNGGSSSGKSGIARCSPAVLPDPWLSLSVDTFVDAMPAAMLASGDGIDVADDGGVHVGPRFRALEATWIAGTAAAKAELVHKGVTYDLAVDTTHDEASTCAYAIAAGIERKP